MSALSEIVKFRRNPEGNIANQPVAEKAKELWNALAPERPPTPELPTAEWTLDYEYDEMNLPIRSYERKLFDSILKPHLIQYSQTRKVRRFEAKLHMNPNYFNRGKVDKNDQNTALFEFHIDVPPPEQPLDGKYVTVFGFAEFPQNIGFGPFKKHQTDIKIVGEGGNYTDEHSTFIIGRPKIFQTTLFRPQTNISRVEANLPYNTAWRKKFATDTLNMLISVAERDSLEERKIEDKLWQETFRQSMAKNTNH